jgi:predicted hydrocarbon binding protein
LPSTWSSTVTSTHVAVPGTARGKRTLQASAESSKSPTHNRVLPDVSAVPMRANKDVLVYAKEKGRKLFLVALDLRSEVGAIADCSARLESAGFSILTGFVSTPGNDNVGRCSFFVEANNPDASASDLKHALEESSHIVGCTVKESHKGIIVDSLSFPLSWNSGDRAFMLRTAFFALMNAKIRGLLGSGADVMLFELGFEHGLPSWRNILADYQVRSKEDLAAVLPYYTAVGWGRVEVVSFDFEAKAATFRIMDNFECGGLKSAKPSSHFVRGHLTGCFATVFGGEAKITESSCISKGDGYCEFKVSA